MLYGPQATHGGRMTKATEPQFIESTAGQVAAELARRGIAPDRHVTIAIEPDDWLADVRRVARPNVVAAGWTDDEIDRLVKQAQKDIEPGPG
jgi:hypothetical protein